MEWHYYKLRQLNLLQSATRLLQIATGITKCDKFITNFDGYYKVWWLSQIATVHTYPSGCRIPPSHSLNVIFFLTGTFTFSHPPNVVLLCSNEYLSLPSYVLTCRKFAWTFLSEPSLSISVMVLSSVQSPLFFRKIVENEHYRRPYWPGRAWTIVKGRRDGLGTPRFALSVHLNPISPLHRLITWSTLSVNTKTVRFWKILLAKAKTAY